MYVVVLQFFPWLASILHPTFVRQFGPFDCCSDIAVFSCSDAGEDARRISRCVKQFFLVASS